MAARISRRLTSGAELLSISALGARGNNVYLAALTRNGSPDIFISTNNGGSFALSRSVIPLTTFAFGSDALYATGPGGVYFSGNNGAYWTPVNSGLVNRTVNRLAVKGETLLAGRRRLWCLRRDQPAARRACQRFRRELSQRRRIGRRFNRGCLRPEFSDYNTSRRINASAFCARWHAGRPERRIWTGLQRPSSLSAPGTD